MADNYLERRMEELRSGRLAVRNRRPGIKPGSSRILIAGGIHAPACEMALQHRREGHRVAIFDENKALGKRMAYENGVRFHHVSLQDKEALGKETEALLRAWRGIDMIVGEGPVCDLIARFVQEWKENLPIKDESAINIVII